VENRKTRNSTSDGCKHSKPKQTPHGGLRGKAPYVFNPQSRNSFENEIFNVMRSMGASIPKQL